MYLWCPEPGLSLGRVVIGLTPPPLPPPPSGASNEPAAASIDSNAHLIMDGSLFPTVFMVSDEFAFLENSNNEDEDV